MMRPYIVALVPTVFDTNRGEVTIVSGNELAGDMGPSTRCTGADLSAALVGTTPPDDAFTERIAEAISTVTARVR
jgi:hypothetical protein